MLDLPYTDIIHTKNLLDEYNLMNNKKSISNYIIKKFCNHNVKSSIKTFKKNLHKEVTLEKSDFINFGRFLICIDNNSREDKIVTVQSSDTGSRFRINFPNGPITYIVDTMKSDDCYLEVTFEGIVKDRIATIIGPWATFMHTCMVDTICNYLTK